MFGFLTSALSTWPIPSFSAAALSSALQRRIVRYLLKKALGHLIKDGDLKVDQIEAGIGSGKVEIVDVHLDPTFINSLLRNTPLRLDFGSVGSISLSIPWANLWGGELSLKLGNVDIGLVIDGSQIPTQLDSLGDSILNAAEEALEQDDEGREIEESIASLADQSTTASDEQTKQVSASYVVSLVDSLIARLSVGAENVRIKLNNETHESNAAIDLQLRLESIGVHPGGVTSQMPLSRHVKFEGVSIWIDRQDIANDGSSSDSDQDDSSFLGESQADLRASMAPSLYASVATAESMYASAISHDTQRPMVDAKHDIGPTKILQLANTPVEVHILVDREVQGAEPGSSRSRRSPLSLSVQIECCPIAVFLTPASLSSLLRFVQDASATTTTSTRMRGQLSPRQGRGSATSTKLRVELAFDAIHLVNAYECPSQLVGESFLQYRHSCDAFWLRPARVNPSIGHLRIRAEEIRFSVEVDREQSGFEASVGDLAIYEHLSPLLAGGQDVPRLLPILVFDANLTQYSHSSALRSEEDMSTTADKLRYVTIPAVDWRARVHGNDKGRSSPYRRMDISGWGWKVKPYDRRFSPSSDGASSDSDHPCVSISGFSTGQSAEALQVRLLPLHIFADTSAVDRLLPLLHQLGASTRSNDKAAWESGMMDASFETVHVARDDSEVKPLPFAKRDPNKNVTDVKCSLVRIELRVSTRLASHDLTPLEAQKRTDLGLDLRSGLAVVDIKTIHLTNAAAAASQEVATAVHFAESPDHRSSALPTQASEQDARSSLLLTLASVDAYYKGVNEAEARRFASVGPLTSDDHADKPLLPRLSYQQDSQAEVSRRFADCQLPIAQVSLSKPLLDGLELMVDDLSIWSSGLRDWHSRSDAENATEALRILGSRFFGTRHSYSTLSSSSTSTETVRQPQPMPVFTLSVHEVRISLCLPAHNAGALGRSVSLSASELEIHFDSQFDHNSTRANISIATLAINLEEHESGAHYDVLSRTLRPSLTRNTPAMLTVQIVSTVEPDTSFRGSQIEVCAQNSTLTYDGNDELIHDLLAFVRSPEGAFEHVEPNELTRINVRLKDISVLLAPLQVSSRAVCVLGDVSLRTKLISDYPRTNVRIAVDDSCLLISESMTVNQDKEIRSRRPADLWTARGLSRVVGLTQARSTVVLSTLTRPEVDVKVTQLAVEVTACADSMETVESLTTAIFSSAKSNTKVGRQRTEQRDEDRDLLASLDERAFVRARTVGSVPDLLDDDVPRHPVFLRGEEQRKGLAIDQPPIGLYEDDILDEQMEEEMTTSRQSKERNKGEVLFNNDIVAVRLLDVGRGIAPTPRYFTNPDLCVPDGRSGSKQASSLRVKVENSDVIVRLFAGYDRQSTRVAIEDEAKKVRKRLQKIKQMLDQGQTPDDSVEDAAATLFDSVHLSLPDGKSVAELDAGALMQIVDDELDDRSETASSASTWKQFVPGRLGTTSGASTPVKRKRSKLARSRESMIDLEFKAIHVDYDAFAPGGELTSRLTVRVGKMRVLDNIRTSTWQTFLTAMATRHGRVPRQAKDMVHLDLSTVQSAVDADSAEEVRCKARISPLRLHVDQDALDFLKKFFTFEVPGRPRPVPTDKAIPRPFIQHAEVYAVKLKLDYKPKRVDYRLLRQGKTIEMMNFFNFEGSEITLRHITLRGITGWSTLFDTLNDLWTPDVKSNQLADVLSGITPIRTLVNVGNGMADLILLPIEQYQRDGRIGRGLREGAKRFVKTTALEAARIGARLATGTQVILEQAEHVLGGNGRTEHQSGIVTGDRSSGPQRRQTALDQFDGSDDADEDADEQHTGGTERALFSRYANQPGDLRQALEEAQRGLSRGFNEAAQTILAVPMEVYERQAGEGGSRPVVRAVPIAVLRSAAGATEAVSKTLQGIHRELSGVQLSDEEQKYKTPIREQHRKLAGGRST